ncbi:MAG TPA: substrate-binding domain-containing protein [Bacillota bacterium]|nr:substrate-binding domain-containing protein [Bacillota bacterium]
MKKICLVLLFVFSITVLAACGQNGAHDAVMVYCGAGMAKPFKEIEEAFKEKTGHPIEVVYVNAVQAQTQINTTGKGDYFVAGAKNELEPIKDKVAESRDLVKHIPVVGVQKGNPKDIREFADLEKEGVGLVIGDPEATPIGKIAMAIFKENGIDDKVNILSKTTTAPQMAIILENKQADAVIVWKENIDPEKMSIADIAGMDKYIKVVPLAKLTSAGDGPAVKELDEFLRSQEAKEIWMKFGYELAEGVD